MRGEKWEDVLHADLACDTLPVCRGGRGDG